jgi:hypothetical protein
MIDVMSELKEVGDCFKTGDLASGLKKLQLIWATVPEPKTDTANSYLILEYAVTFALKMRDLEEAKKWASLAPLFVAKRQDSGEVEFLVAKVALECGKMEVAKENLIIADKKSEGRVLQGQDPKYRALIP